MANYVCRHVLAVLTFAALLATAVPAHAIPLVAPVNDDFSNASTIDMGALPYANTVDVTDATTENNEPFYCAYSYQTVWYKFTPATSMWLAIDNRGGSLLASYTLFRDGGSGITSLSVVRCSYYSDSTTVYVQGGTSYYIQVLAPCCFNAGTVRLNVRQTTAPSPVANFYYYPGDPSIFEDVRFNDASYDPGQLGLASWSWTFGDGASAQGCCPTHRFAADGSYAVRLVVTTIDGRTDDTTLVVTVRTHDVAITKFQTPQSASMGQTRQITVGIRNTRYPEMVRVELQRSVVGGPFDSFETVGGLRLYVPVRASNRTTDFNFSYVFDGDDALIGKVTFRAIATLDTARDAVAGDNVAISLPTKVGRSSLLLSDKDPAATEVKAAFALFGAVPNPSLASSDLRIRFSLAAEGTASLQVLDIAGRVMAESDLSALGPGPHDARLAWRIKPSPGLYWVRLRQGTLSATKRIGVLP